MVWSGHNLHSALQNATLEKGWNLKHTPNLTERNSTDYVLASFVLVNVREACRCKTFAFSMCWENAKILFMLNTQVVQPIFYYTGCVSGEINFEWKIGNIRVENFLGPMVVNVIPLYRNLEMLTSFYLFQIYIKKRKYGFCKTTFFRFATHDAGEQNWAW